MMGTHHFPAFLGGFQILGALNPSFCHGFWGSKGNHPRFFFVYIDGHLKCIPPKHFARKNRPKRNGVVISFI